MDYANQFVLDQNDAGFWMARWHSETYPIGGNKNRAKAIVGRLNASHRPNLEVRGGDLWVCWNDHEKGQPCKYELLVRNAYNV